MKTLTEILSPLSNRLVLVTPHIQKAIDECALKGGGDVVFPSGKYFSGPIFLKSLATPGHSPGGICLLHESEGILFCGDCLFAGSIGRTDFPGCSTKLLMNSIETKIMSLPDSIVCLPGHGPKTTVGAERASNPFLQGDYFV